MAASKLYWISLYFIASDNTFQERIRQRPVPPGFSRLLLVPPDTEKGYFVFRKVHNGTGGVHAASGRAGIDQAGPELFFVVADVGMTEKHIIVLLRLHGLEKPLFIVAVQHGNLSSGQRQFSKTSQKVYAEVPGIKAQLAAAVGVAQNHVQWNVDFLKKRRHFGQHHFRADISAMANRFNPAKNKFSGGSQR